MRNNSGTWRVRTCGTRQGILTPDFIILKQQQSKSRTVSLHDEGGPWITKDKDVEKVVVEYFKDLFSSILSSKFENFQMWSDQALLLR